MGKVTSLYGKTSGKIGSIVFSTSGGETIAREYNPHVSNPSTMAQINQRARMKLMSQLSASLSPVLAIPKKGLVSARNQFTKMNFDQSMAVNGVAQITYENVQLTNGNLGLPTIEATRAQGSGISINLAEDAHLAINRVVYILYRKTSEQKLQLVSSVVVEAAGNDGNFPATLPYTEGDIVLYAYGMRDTSESASAKYGNMQVANAVDVARLTAVRNISSEDFQFTETRGATMYADQSEVTPVPEGSARVFVTTLGNGSATGAGVYVIGDNATVVATPASGAVFLGWRLNGSIEIISTDASYTFEVQGTTDLIAVFENTTPGSTYNVTVKVSPSNTGALEDGCKVKVGQQEATEINLVVNAGDTISLEAVESTNYEFKRWQIAGSTFATDNPYRYVPQGDVVITAGFDRKTI